MREKEGILQEMGEETLTDHITWKQRGMEYLGNGRRPERGHLGDWGAQG